MPKFIAAKNDIKILFIIFLSAFTFSCSIKDIEKPGNIVPPTADQDFNLPQLNVTVSGLTRKIHLQTFGNPQNPPVFILPGGPGADFRLLLPLKQLADSFYVVMWDPRGAGLSERVTKQELTFESFDEEITSVKTQLSPNRKISVIGHSFGCQLFLHYTAQHQNDVEKMILIEPGQINLGIKTGYNGGAVSFLDGMNFFWSNEIITSTDHAAADFKAIDLLPKSSRNFTCDKSVFENYPLWRFGAYHYYIVLNNARRLPKKYNWASGIENFAGKISMIAGTCGAASENFQRTYNLPELPQADITVVPGAGHLSLFTNYAAQTIQAVRNKLR
jgi:proline iminopeptidase